MKPTCKAESRWKYWKEDCPSTKNRRYRKDINKLMKRARRRFEKTIQNL